MLANCSSYDSTAQTVWPANATLAAREDDDMSTEDRGISGDHNPSTDVPTDAPIAQSTLRIKIAELPQHLKDRLIASEGTLMEIAGRLVSIGRPLSLGLCLPLLWEPAVLSNPVLTLLIGIVAALTVTCFVLAAICLLIAALIRRSFPTEQSAS